MIACRSDGVNEFTRSSVVGVPEGEAAGSADDFDSACGDLLVDNGGVGDCAARFAIKTKLINVACNNRGVTMIRRA